MVPPVIEGREWPHPKLLSPDTKVLDKREKNKTMYTPSQCPNKKQTSSSRVTGEITKSEFFFNYIYISVVLVYSPMHEIEYISPIECPLPSLGLENWV